MAKPNLFLALILLCCLQALYAQTESEPNNVFANATLIDATQVISGKIGADGDRHDYYKTLLPASGTVAVNIEGTHTGGSAGSFAFYAYDKSGRQIASKGSLGSPVAEGGVVTDEIRIVSQGADSIYFLLYQGSNRTFDYKISYTIADVHDNDNEPNNAFAQAVELAAGQSAKGLIGYVADGATDRNDYYKTLLPESGTVKVYIEGTHTGGSSGSISFYAYDKSRRQIASKGSLGNIVSDDGTIRDTIEIMSRGADSLYFLIYQGNSRSYSYTLSYQMADIHPDDEEPNDSREQASPIAAGQERTGKIGYTADGQTDRSDYYRTTLPDNGTVEVKLEATHTGGSSGALWIYAYDASGRQIGSKQIGDGAVQKGDTVEDILAISSRSQANETLYFRVYQGNSRSFAYRLSYEVGDLSEADPEPNNGFAQAGNINAGETLAGLIGYTADGVVDRNDYYKTQLPASGTVTVYIEGTHTGGSRGSFGFYAYDKSRRQIASKGSIGDNVDAGGTVRDTIEIVSRAADSLYFLIYQGNNRSFSYQLSYEVLDQHHEDAEPNSSFGQAVIVNVQDSIRGQIGYEADGAVDRNDYYKTLLPADGTVKVYIEGLHTGGSTGSFGFYAYDKSRRQIASKGSIGANVGRGGVVLDSIEITSQAADSVYFLIYQGNNRSFSYRMHYELADQGPNDPEPNNTFPQAADLLVDETAQGFIGNVADGATDRNDYYQTLLPEDGTIRVYIEGVHTGGSTGSFGFYAYDKSRRQIASKGSIGANVSKGGIVRDTIDIYARAADSVYFLVYQGNNRSFHYSFRYEVVDRSPNDWEPNNTFVEATTTSVSDRIEGHIGYVADGSTDRNDYYVLPVPANGNIDIYVDALNTGGRAGNFQIYAYDKARRQVSTRTVGGSTFAHGERVRDTVSLACVQTDSLYLLVYHGGSAAFQYSITMNHVDRQPTASFGFERIGHEVGFRAEAGNADEYLWDFGDGTTATGRFPMKVYGFGAYTARLITVNSVCGLRDTAEHKFEFRGVEYFTPDAAGIGGDAAIQVFGGGLSSDTQVRLRMGGNTLPTESLFASPTGTSLRANFDLHFAEPGVYDVLIDIPGEEPLVYPQAFTLNALAYPTTWSEITGPEEWRVGRDTRFSLVVGNNGNVTASGVVVALMWPRAVTVTFEDQAYVPDEESYSIVDDDGNTHTISREDLLSVYDDSETHTPIDSFKNKPYHGNIRLLMIPHVPAGSTIELPFMVRATAPSAQKFITYTLKPNFFGSCFTVNYVNFFDWMAVEGLDLFDSYASEKKAVPLMAFTKSAKIGRKHLALSAKYLGYKFWSKVDGYEMNAEIYADLWKELDGANEHALQAFVTEAGNVTHSAAMGKFKQVQGQYNKQRRDVLNKRIARGDRNGHGGEKWLEKYRDELREMDGITDLAKRVERLDKAFDLSTKLGKKVDLVNDLAAIRKIIEKDCPELKEQLDKLLEDLGDEFVPREEREKDTRSIGSMDPNAIYGPTGVGAARFVNKTDRHTFLVTFENVDTASASAQIVKVESALDPHIYDLSTFEFGNVTIGTEYYRVPKGRKEFVLDLPPTDRLPLRVRVNAALDTLTGIINWQFYSIDPNTGDLPLLAGVLPPNVNYPDGEGSVSYSVNLRQDIGNAVEMKNSALIFFDDNEPIQTNEWLNTTDLLYSTSSLTARVEADTIIRVQLSGTDGGSGIGYYRIFYAEADGEWHAASGTVDDTISFVGDPGSTYRFFVMSADRVGNVEEKAPIAEATVTIAGEPTEPVERERPPKQFILAPNPSSTGTPTIISAEYTGRATVRVANAIGQEVASPIQLDMRAGLGTPIDLSRLGSGIYFLLIRTDDGNVHRDKLIIHKP